jgi:hypothetical protein
VSRKKKRTGPHSLGDLKDLAFQASWGWLRRRSRTGKTAAGSVAVLALLAAARLGFVGDTALEVVRTAVPVRVPGIDPPDVTVTLTLSYEVEDHLGRRAGRIGDACCSGSHIFIRVQASDPVWLSVFGVDAKGIHPIFGNGLDPRYVEEQQAYVRDFWLDETLGQEIYYAVARKRKFSFERDIEPRLATVFPTGSSKGPLPSRLDVGLPVDYAQRSVYFTHVDCGPAAPN